MDDATIESWMSERTEITAPRIEQVRTAHPGLPLRAALEQEGLLPAALRQRLERELLEELGLPPRIGELELIRELGRGGMGVVIEAHDRELDRAVALKVLPGALALRGSAVERFRRECQAVARLDHPRIVRLYRTGTHQGISYAVLELIDGVALDAVLRRRAARLATRPLPPRDPFHEPLAAEPTVIAAEFAEIARALEHAHQQGVVHRDIKPSNLIVSRDGNLRILDFGLARLDDAERVTFTGDLLGTPQYMSPEQIGAGRVATDHRTDIYSLGATLYESLTDQPPFQGASAGELYSAILFKQPRPPSVLRPGLPRGLESIVLKCLHKNPDERYASAVALADDIGRWLQGAPLEAVAPGRRERLAWWVARVGHPRVALLLLALAGLIGLGALSQLWVLWPAGIVAWAAVCVALRTPDEEQSLRLLAFALCGIVLYCAGLILQIEFGYPALLAAVHSSGSRGASLLLRKLLYRNTQFFNSVWFDALLGLSATLVWMQMAGRAARLRSLAGLVLAITLAHVAVVHLGFLSGAPHLALCYHAVWLMLLGLSGAAVSLANTLAGVDGRRSLRWLALQTVGCALLALGLWYGPRLLAQHLETDVKNWRRAHQLRNR